MKNPWADLPKPLVYLAPMSGVTNRAYRQIVKQFHSDVLFPEFVSIDGMHFGSEKTNVLLEYDEIERPIIAQVFGARPAYFFEAAQKVVELGFDGVDINFGCPAPKVAKNGGGCALLGDLGLCREIIQATLDGAAGRIPVSVKTRMSFGKTHVREFCRVIADLPLANLCVHGRPFEKPYLGSANLDPIREAKTLIPFPVTASGHAHTPEAAKETLDYTGCDGVALARGTFGKPWIGKQIKDYLETGTYTEPTLSEKLNVMLEHARLVERYHTNRPFVEIRKILGWYVRDFPNAANYRSQLVRVNTIQEIEQIVTQIQK
ncbi:MAG: tRNA-dihydrouridine synthase [Candidatus Kerfeldbacteria bacterium]|nr:tRNA-dihydrouridine synthase [Candidatus Kerfeldbacteria bacterium]